MWLAGVSFFTVAFSTLGKGLRRLRPALPSWRVIAITLALLLFLMALPQPSHAEDVSLAWDANVETDLAGYKVYWGTASRTYGTPVTIGLITTYTVTGLPPGHTYYFAVTAFNDSGLESGYSNEVYKLISLIGDLNGDGFVNVLDVQIMINAILGIAPNSGADLNGDGSVNVLDLQILVNMVLSTG